MRGCCAILTDVQLEQIREFKYLGCVLNKRGLDVANVNYKVTEGRAVAVNLKWL